MAAMRIQVRILGTVQGVGRTAWISALLPEGSDTGTSICCIYATALDIAGPTRPDAGDHKCYGPGMRRYLRPARYPRRRPATPPATPRNVATTPGAGPVPAR